MKIMAKYHLIIQFSMEISLISFLVWASFVALRTGIIYIMPRMQCLISVTRYRAAQRYYLVLNGSKSKVKLQISCLRYAF